MATNPAAFANDLAPSAAIASARTGIPSSVILAQWGIETGWGTSNLFRNSNNFAGIRPVGGSGFMSYPDRAAGLQAYIANLNTKLYASVRNAGTDPVTSAKALAASPWDAGHYGGDGTMLVDAIKNFGLTKFDTATPSGQPASSGGGSGVGDFLAGVGSGLTAPINAVSGLVSGKTATDAATSAAGSLASGIGDAIKTPLLTVVFVSAGVGLVVLGAWKAVSPVVKPAIDKAGEAAKTAATAAVA